MVISCQVVERRRPPEFIRRDNRPEPTANAWTATHPELS
jgi:hypothetical protein